MPTFEQDHDIIAILGNPKDQNVRPTLTEEKIKECIELGCKEARAVESELRTGRNAAIGVYFR